MKIISKDGAIAALSFIADEVKPLGGYYVPGLLAAMQERYQFGKTPTHEEATTVGARFQNGHFSMGKRDIALAEVAIYREAIAVTTTDTKDSEIVLTELIEWLIATFKFRQPSTPPVRAYQSDLIVEFDNNPEKAFDHFQKLSTLLQNFRGKLGHQAKPVQFNRFALGCDPILPGPNADFIVERRAGILWEQGRYFSKAHLPTDAHIEALELFDKLLAKR